MRCEKSRSVDRLVPTDEGAELIGLVREIATGELAPRAAAAEAAGEFPRDVYRLLGEAGVLGMPYPMSTAAPTSRTRSTCRPWRRSPAPG